MKTLANLHLTNIVITGSVIYASYSILRYYHTGMNDNIERTKENSKKPSQRGDNNKNQRAIVSRDIKNRMEKAITKPNIDGDPTRSDE
jgi:hypothetical protein